MPAALRSFLLALVLGCTLAFMPVAAVAGHTTVERKAIRLRLQRGEWLRLVPVRPRPRPLGERAVAFAKRFLGAPYRWGGASPGGFDCSGLVRYVYQRFGIDLPHSSYADFDLGRRVSRGSLRPGDLVFFSGLGHVGMYVGHGRFIHAPHTGTRVQISTLAEYGADYDGARRLIHT